MIENSSKNGIFVSLRKSLIENYRQMMVMNTKEYSKFEAVNIMNGDVRNRLIKYGQSIEVIQLNMLVMGIV